MLLFSNPVAFIVFHSAYYIFMGLYAYIFYLILKRGKGFMHVIISLHYLITLISYLLSFIYFYFNQESIVIILGTISIFLLFFGLVFLLAFTLILRRGEDIDSKHVFAIITIYGLVLLGSLLIPNQLTFFKDGQIAQQMSLSLGVFLIIFITIYCVVPTSWFSIKILKKFTNDELKKKWRYFTIGEIGMFSIYYFILVDYTWGLDQMFRIFLSLYLLPSYLIWGYFLYKGVVGK